MRYLAHHVTSDMYLAALNNCSFKLLFEDFLKSR